MAKLSAHGTNLQIEYLDCKIAICSDGNILRNSGPGWKLWRKLKPGVNYREAYERRMEKLQRLLYERPVHAALRKYMLEWKLEDRQRILLYFDLLSDDIDGIYSELTDGYPKVHIDLDELQEIRSLIHATRHETERLNVQAPATATAPTATALDGF